MMKFVIAAALVAAPAVPAFAQQTARVAYKADELATASGRAALQRRVKLAVIQVCGTDNAPGSLFANSKVRACYRTAAASARPQVERAIALAVRDSDVASAR